MKLEKNKILLEFSSDCDIISFSLELLLDKKDIKLSDNDKEEVRQLIKDLNKLTMEW